MKALVLVLVLSAPLYAQAPGQPYAGQETRAIKALSPEEVAALLKGEGAGFAKAAELNRYPGPRHTLDFAAQLELTDAQRARIQAIYDSMNGEAIALGTALVERERELDQLFASRGATAANIAGATAAIAALQGVLRERHLRAHLDVTALLTPEQIQLYDALRGYGEHSKAGEHTKH